MAEIEEKELTFKPTISGKSLLIRVRPGSYRFCLSLVGGEALTHFCSSSFVWCNTGKTAQ
jgi:hypothetical protein